MRVSGLSGNLKYTCYQITDHGDPAPQIKRLAAQDYLTVRKTTLAGLQKIFSHPRNLLEPGFYKIAKHVYPSKQTIMCGGLYTEELGKYFKYFKASTPEFLAALQSATKISFSDDETEFARKIIEKLLPAIISGVSFSYFDNKLKEFFPLLAKLENDFFTINWPQNKFVPKAIDQRELALARKLFRSAQFQKKVAELMRENIRSDIPFHFTGGGGAEIWFKLKDLLRLNAAEEHKLHLTFQLDRHDEREIKKTGEEISAVRTDILANLKPLLVPDGGFPPPEIYGCRRSQPVLGESCITHWQPVYEMKEPEAILRQFKNTWELASWDAGEKKFIKLILEMFFKKELAGCFALNGRRADAENLFCFPAF